MARGYLVPQYRDLFLHGCQIVLLTYMHHIVHEIMKKPSQRVQPYPMQYRLADLSAISAEFSAYENNSSFSRPQER